MKTRSNSELNPTYVLAQLAPARHEQGRLRQRLRARLQFAVHPDQDGGVARIVFGVVGGDLFVHAGS